MGVVFEVGVPVWVLGVDRLADLVSDPVSSLGWKLYCMHGPLRYPRCFVRWRYAFDFCLEDLYLAQNRWVQQTLLNNNASVVHVVFLS